MNALLPPNIQTLVASLHPAFAMRGLPQLRGPIRAAIARAKRFAVSGERVNRNFDFFPEPNPDALATALAGATKFVVDVETPRNNDRKITLCGVATSPSEAWVCSWKEPYISIIKAALESPKHVKIGHNLSFDAKAFRQYGISLVYPVVDTIQAAALLWPNQPAPKKDAAKGGGAKFKMLSLAACVLRTQNDVAYWKDVDRDPRIRAFYRVAWSEVPDWLHPWLYCANDCINNFKLWLSLREYLVKENMLNLFASIVAPAGVVLHTLESRGIKLDEARRAQMIEECETTIKESKLDLTSRLTALHTARQNRIKSAIEIIEATKRESIVTAPVACEKHPMSNGEAYKGLTKRGKCETCLAGFNAASTLREMVKGYKTRIQLGTKKLAAIDSSFEKLSDDYWRWVLFDKAALGFTPKSFTKKKRIAQVDDEVMEKLKATYPNEPILQLRVALQQASHRLKNRLWIKTEADGRVHFVVSLHKAGTGRGASGSDDTESDKLRVSPGNAQNIPDKDRRMYIPEAGHSFIQGDWSQIEARVFAWNANETKMLEAFASGQDIHSLNATSIFGCDYAAAKEFQVYFAGEYRTAREAAKRSTHGLNYYMLVWGLMNTFGLVFEEAKRVFDGYHAQWPGILPYQNMLIDKAAKDGYLVNTFGRKDWYYFFERTKEGRWMPRDPGRAVAFTSQSDVGEMMKVMLKLLDSKNINILTTTHDSFLAEVPTPEVEQQAKLIQATMQHTWPEFGKRKIFGEYKQFVSPADVAIGLNWGKFHEHKLPACADCKREENLEGLLEIKFA